MILVFPINLFNYMYQPFLIKLVPQGFSKIRELKVRVRSTQHVPSLTDLYQPAQKNPAQQ